MASKLCPFCSAWQLAEDDAYCGYCGQPGAQLTLSASDQVFLAGELAPSVTLTLHNPTCGHLSVTGVVPPGWMKVMDTVPAKVAAASQISLRLRVNTHLMKGPDAGQVQVQTEAGTASLLLIAIAEKPALAVLPAEIECWWDRSDRSQRRKRITLELWPLAGHLRIRQVAAVPSWMRVMSDFAEPAIVSAEKKLPVEIEIDTEAMEQAVERFKPAPIQLRATYDSPTGPHIASIEFTLTLKNSPELYWEDQHTKPPEKFATHEQPLVLSFSNKAQSDPQDGRRNAALILDDVKLTSKAGVVARLTSSLPIRVIGGDPPCKIAFQLDLEGVRPAYDHEFTLQFRSNRRSLDRPYRVQVGVRNLDAYDGVIAIDFGSSNTCCMVCPSGGEMSSVELDEHSSIAPTVVQYVDLSGAVPEIETGLRVKLAATADDAAAASTLGGLKQQLGEATSEFSVRPVRSKQWVKREARSVAADYLRQIRVIAERQQGAFFERFILTHPAVCSLRQYRNLRNALGEAFGGAKKPRFIQEPIAALVPFFDQMAQKPGQPDYTVAAFDLGGGTTDITVVRVRHIRTSANQIEIHPRIEKSWGERFGGENLTNLLVDEIKLRCRSLLAAENPGFSLAEDKVKGASKADIMRNKAALQWFAEGFKAGLSEEPGAEPPPKDLILRAVHETPDVHPKDVRFRVEDLRRAGTADLEKLFQERVRSYVSGLIAPLREYVSRMDTVLGHIQLSGKTTFLPVVREVVKSCFAAEIHRADDPKQCVARGACLAGRLAQGHAIRLMLPQEVQRTTFALGLMDEGARQFLKIIPYDCPIPAEGLVAERARAWNGEDNVLLWENLGVDDQRYGKNGSPNPTLNVLDSWEPAARCPQPPESWLTLRVTLKSDFTLEVSAIDPNGNTISFRPRGTGGL